MATTSTIINNSIRLHIKFDFSFGYKLKPPGGDKEKRYTYEVIDRT